jgi:hypothetical protein
MRLGKHGGEVGLQYLQACLARIVGIACDI